MVNENDNDIGVAPQYATETALPSKLREVGTLSGVQAKCFKNAILSDLNTLDGRVKEVASLALNRLEAVEKRATECEKKVGLLEQVLITRSHEDTTLVEATLTLHPQEGRLSKIIRPTTQYFVDLLGKDIPESPAGSMDGCRYSDGFYTTRDGGAFAWDPTPSAQCEYVAWKSFKGFMSQDIWLIKDREVALTFNDSSFRTLSCGVKLIVTDQGYGVSLAERTKRSTENTANKEWSVDGKVNYVTSNQLAAQLLALEKAVLDSSANWFARNFLDWCHNLNSLTASTLAAAASNPTLAARQMLRKENVHARFVSKGYLAVQTCSALAPDSYRLPFGPIFVRPVRQFVRRPSASSAVRPVRPRTDRLVRFVRFVRFVRHALIGWEFLIYGILFENSGIENIGSFMLFQDTHFTKGKCVPSGPQSYEFILGNDLLQRLPKFYLDYTKGFFEIGEDKLPLGQQRNASIFPSRHAVHVMKDTAIPARSESFVSSCSNPDTVTAENDDTQYAPEFKKTKTYGNLAPKTSDIETFTQYTESELLGFPTQLGEGQPKTFIPQATPEPTETIQNGPIQLVNMEEPPNANYPSPTTETRDIHPDLPGLFITTEHPLRAYHGPDRILAEELPVPPHNGQRSENKYMHDSQRSTS
uniref:AAA_12 domain-containing protein n=1 Tax=Caenorhabditis japonica TaxID=281687 RepID=A0A8R1HI73_CAEJA